MVIDRLCLDENLQEKLPLAHRLFPHISYYVNLSEYHEKYVAWHWHPELEFSWILRGTIEISTPNHTCRLSAGEGIFINSNVLHTIRPASEHYPTALTQVFDSQLIAGTHGSIFEQKYVLPITENKEIEMLVFHPGNPDHQQVLDLIHKAYEISEHQPFGYEFMIRNALSDVWMLLCSELNQKSIPHRISGSQDEERIKKMLLYIENNYMQKISLQQISESANISKRECLRCFERSLNMTPFTWLMEYRVRMAAKMMRETNRPITTIAYDTGFCSTSYFGKIFKKIIGQTPSQYRTDQGHN